MPKGPSFLAFESGPNAAFYYPAVAAHDSRGLVVWQSTTWGKSVAYCRLLQLDIPGPVVAADLDRSGKLDAVDVQRIVNAALEISVEEEPDPDYDGDFNALDIQLVINGALGLVIDADGDGLTDAAEGNLCTLPDQGDTDGDGVNDGPEMLSGTNPLTDLGSPGGVPAASQEVLDFGANQSELPLDIHLTGSRTQPWAIDRDDAPAWLHLSAWEGILGPDTSTTLVAGADRSSLAPGLYGYTLPVTSAIGRSLVTIQMRVGGAEPILEVGPSPIDLDANTNVALLHVANAGSETLDWGVQQDLPAWLSAVPAGGLLLPGGMVDVELRRNPMGLSPGEYTHKVFVASNGGADLIQLRMQVNAADPILFLSGEALVFPPPLEQGTFVLENRGGGKLTWAVEPDLPGWITVTPMAGELEASEEVTAEVNVSRTGLDSGHCEHTVTISSNGGEALVQVAMGVPPPLISVAPLVIDLGEDSSEADVTLSNTGGGTLIWSIDGVLPDWLLAMPKAGQLAMNSGADLHLQVMRDGLSTGDYTHDLWLKSNDADVFVQVRMSVLHP